MKKLLDFFKKEFPSDVVDINECLQLLNECIDGTVTDITQKASACFANRDFEKMEKYQQCVTEIDKLQIKLESYIALLDMDEPSNDAEEDKNILPDQFDRKVDYSEYTVDSTTEHSLIENLTHKRPAAFKLLGTKIEANDWKEVYTLTCEVLAKKDLELFKSFLTDKTMQGKKVAYFATTSTGMRNPAFISEAKVYVTTNMSANSIRDVIQKMLKKYGISLQEYILYFKADYSTLHIEDNQEEIFNNGQENDKIGKFVRLSLRELSDKQYQFSPNDLLAMQSKEWSKSTLGIDYPLLKPCVNGIDIQVQIREGSYLRYWKEIFEYNGNKYLVTSQWFEQNRSKFTCWLDKVNSNER